MCLTIRTESDRPWLVSKLAIPLNDAFGDNQPLKAVIRLCLALAETLAAMHERGVAHRDIKPENIFLDGERWSLGDLGLADFPDKGAITSEGEKLGPMYYIAPEMLNNAAGADGRPADVFSLSKLMWKLTTGQRYPLPGVQSADQTALTLSAYVAEAGVHSLDRLIEAATQTDPRRRPTMREFSNALAKWLEPPSEPSGPLDLRALQKRIQHALEPHLETVRRRTDSQARADRERDRLFKLFRPTIQRIASALVTAGIPQTHVVGPDAGTNYHNLVSGIHGATHAGTRLWLYEHGVQCVMSDQRRNVVLLGGIDLGFRNVEGESEQVHDIYAPVLVSAGYIVIGPGDSTRLIWGRGESFSWGSRLKHQLSSSYAWSLRLIYKLAAEELVQAFEKLKY